jgi:mitotic-spindle organizing protein 1
MDPVKQSIDLLHEMSLILNTGLDRETLCMCISLIESGVNPEALTAVIKELQREAQALRST